MENQGKELRKISGSVFARILCVALLLFAIILPFGLFSGKSVEKTSFKPEEAEQSAAGPEVIREPRDVPGIYFASAQEETGATEAPRTSKGGAIYVGSGVTFTWSGSMLKQHSAVYGGAIYVACGGHFIMNGGAIAFNHAIYGGAIYVEAGATVELNAGTITGNASVAEVSAIYVEDSEEVETVVTVGANFTIENNYTQIYNNYVAYYVDGSFVSVASLDISDLNFDLSTAPLDYENCCGYFKDEKLSEGIENGERLASAPVQSAISLSNVGQVYCIYTRTATPDKLQFELNGDGITYYVKQSNPAPTGEVVIPREYNGLSVTVIYGTSSSNGAFCGNTKITAVYMPNTIEGIGVYAFGRMYYANTTLTFVNIPNSVITIGSNAFYHCSGLTSITIGENVTSIGSSAFSYCDALEHVNYNAINLTNVPSISAFISSGNTGYGINVVIGDNVTQIPANLFYPSGNYCHVSRVTIGENVTSIGSSAFGSCYRIVEVINKSQLNIAAGGTGNGSVGYYASAVVTSEEDKGTFITENGVIYYTNSHISGLGKIAMGVPDKAITKLVLASGCTKVQGLAFFGCGDLVSITIPENVTSIGYVSCLCSYLVEVINKSQLNITMGSTDHGYVGNSASAIVTKEGDAGTFTTENGVIYYQNSHVENVGKVAVRIADRTVTSISIANDCTKIQRDAFSNCSELTTVVIPNSVTSIDYTAFSGCYKLTSVTIGSGVTNIARYAFVNCSFIKTVTIDSATVAGRSSSDSYLLNYATTVYVKDTIATSSVGTWITGSFTYQETTGGYHRYTKNS